MLRKNLFEVMEFAHNLGYYLEITTNGILIIVLFIIGLFVVLGKKLSKKVKVIVISALITLAILGYSLMNLLISF